MTSARSRRASASVMASLCRSSGDCLGTANRKQQTAMRMSMEIPLYWSSMRSAKPSGRRLASPATPTSYDRLAANDELRPIRVIGRRGLSRVWREYRSDSSGAATSRSCRSPPNSTQWRTSGSSYATTGFRTASTNPTRTSWSTAASPGTSSSTCPGKSCPSEQGTGPTGHVGWSGEQPVSSGEQPEVGPQLCGQFIGWQLVVSGLQLCGQSGLHPSTADLFGSQTVSQIS
jgi:hypothetical protein